MHEDPAASPSAHHDEDGLQAVPWYRMLNGYHWFVFIVCSLGWLFDTMDQQLFNIARRPAMRKLLEPSPGRPASRRAAA